jgi:MFS family permease
MDGAPKEKLISKDFIMLTLFSGVLMVFSQMFFPIMALYTKKITNNDFITGIIPGIFMLAGIFAVRFSVPVVKRFGKAMTMAIGCAIMTLSSVFYFFSSNVWMLILARIIQGLGNGLCMPANNAAVADILPKSRLMEGMGYYSLVQTIAQALAPAFVLNLAQNNPNGYRIIFSLSFVLAAICCLLTFTVTYEKKGLYKDTAPAAAEAAGGKGAPAAPENLRLFMGIETTLFLPMLMMFVSAFVMQGFGSYLPLAMQEKGIPSITYFFTIQAVAVFASRLLVSRLADKYGAGVILVPSFLIIAASVYVVSIAKNAATLYILAVPYGFASGASFPAMNGLFFKIGARGRNAETSAAFSAMTNLSAIMLAIVVAVISEVTHGYQSIYNGMFILPLIGFVAYFFHAAQLKRRNAERLENRV